MAADKTKKRQKKLTTSEFVEVEEDGTIVFKTKSSDGTKYYTQRIVLEDLADLKERTDLKENKKIALALSGDIRVSCSCPAYIWWGNSYIITYLKANEDDGTTIFPKVRNPELEGSVCKHLLNVFEVLPFNTGDIIRELKNKNLF